MPRAIVTAGLGETIRNLRLQNKIQAKQLAAHIGKSPAFVSKLENGSIQSIDSEELITILRFVAGEESQTELAEKIYKSLKLKYSAKEIEEQLWFVNYDTVNCVLPMPETLIDDLNGRIGRLGITRQYLLDRINANEALSDEERADNSISYNQWYHPKQKKDLEQSIKIQLSENRLNRILDKGYAAAPYVFIFCILFYLLKIEQYQDVVPISEEQNAALMKETTSVLNSHKFLSISEKNRLLSEKQSQEEIQDILNSFDKDNIEILNDIISGFKVASEQNIIATNRQLKAFGKNMRWDLGFMLRIISMDFSSLKDTSVSNRKKLLSEIEALLVKYSELPEDQNRIETY